MHKKPHLRKPSANGQPKSFDDDLERLRGFGYENKETLGELLFHFFRRYAYDLDYEKNVVSVREGKLISKEGKKWHFMQNNRLCVEEPFNVERNLGNTADDTSVRGIHLELRRAFDLVKDARLSECLEEYVFPAAEEKIWEKPVSRPPPVLSRSRSQSQSSRGNKVSYGIRGGGRHGPSSQRNSGRRSSSAAAFNKFTLPQLNVHGMPARDHTSRDQLQAQYEQLQLHHELFNKFQFLQAQEHELRLLQAQNQLHAQMHAQGSTNGAPFPHQPPAARDQHRTSVSNQIPLTDPLRSGQFFHPFQYPQVSGTPHQSVHTQPSSPSMKPVQPDLRRSVHRSSVAENPSASNRSHSQPARPLPPNLATQNVPPVPLNNQAFLQYQQHLRQQQQLYSALEVTQGRPRPVEMPTYPDPRRIPLDHGFEESVPKEYVGYWVNDSPPQRGYREDHNVQRLPTYQDLHPRVRGVPPNLSRLRDASRSPSPSPAMPFRDRSFSIRSVSSAPPQPVQSRFEKVQPSMLGPRNQGTSVVNGNDGWTIPDYSMVRNTSSHATSTSEATSGSNERQFETPVTAEYEASSSRGLEEVFSLDEPSQYFRSPFTSEPPRVPLANRSENFDSTPRQTSHLGEVPISPNTTYRQEKPNRSAGGLGIQFGEHEVRRPSLKVEDKISPKTARGSIAVPSLESKSEQKAPVSLPLLSPVSEVRSPSPTAKRREDAQPRVQHPYRRVDLYIPPFADLLKAKQEKKKSASAQKPNGVLPSHANDSIKFNELSHMSSTNQPARGPKSNPVLDESPKGSMHYPQSNGWQQQQSGRKSKKNRSRPNSGQFPGEQMPINEAERKGG